MLALPGSSYLYQGEELGLEQVDVPGEHRQDPSTSHGRGDGPRRLPGADPVVRRRRRRTAFGPGNGAALAAAARRLGRRSRSRRSRPTRTRRWRSTGPRWPPDRQLAADWDDDIAWLDVGADVLAFRRGPVTVVVNCGDDAIELPGGDVVVATEELDGRLPANAAVWLR